MACVTILTRRFNVELTKIYIIEIYKEVPFDFKDGKEYLDVTMKIDFNGTKYIRRTVYLKGEWEEVKKKGYYCNG
jgi:hypothetical protein